MTSRSITRPWKKKPSDEEWERAVGKREHVKKARPVTEEPKKAAQVKPKETFARPIRKRHGSKQAPRSVFNPDVKIELKPFALVFEHGCGNPMSVLVDSEGPNDIHYRTWAVCLECGVLGLIQEGKWKDELQLGDLELFKPPSTRVN